MRRRTLIVTSLLFSSLMLSSVTGASAESADDHGDDHHVEPIAWTLDQRATLSADYLAEGPPSGALADPANGRTVPFAGQVIPGFSGMVDNGDGTMWAMPDNGFGTKANSADFLLRVYLIRPQWESSSGGNGAIDVVRFISLRDPDHQVPFAIVNQDTPERLLTGGDFDIESIVRAKDGSWWIGEEFGPFLIHIDSDGKVLQAPVPFIGGKSPQNPTLAAGETPIVQPSRGFESLAMSPGGRFLYPIVEGALTNDTQKRRRWIYQFDVRRNAYTGKRWAYMTSADRYVVGDAVMTGDGEMMVIERDDLEGAVAATKKVYRFNVKKTDDTGAVRKELVADLLYIENSNGIPANAPAGSFGLGNPFSFALQSVETLVALKDGRLMIANDNNYPGSNGRMGGTPDDIEMIVISPAEEPDQTTTPDRLVIGHRGASGYRPEHTVASYELAIRQCAAFIEPDLVSTKDGVLVARHENDITGTTDVADHPEFADRKVTKTIDGMAATGWFTEDFTLAELKTLRAVERLPALRPANVTYNGVFDVPTFEEVIQLAQRYRTCDGNPVGIYPETKHPTYFDSVGLSLEEPLVAMLNKYGYDSPDSAVFVQSFEVGNLRQLNEMTAVPLVQLVNCIGAPYDAVAAGSALTYAEMSTANGLAGVAEYADGVGVCKDLMIPRTDTGSLGPPTALIADAHASSLVVHGWTFRAENNFLPTDLRSSTNSADYGDLTGELRAFLCAGMDGFFTDQPDRGVAAVASLVVN
jgi:glycerophosphoryl diester phosphodiesterase